MCTYSAKSSPICREIFDKMLYKNDTGSVRSGEIGQIEYFNSSKWLRISQYSINIRLIININVRFILYLI